MDYKKKYIEVLERARKIHDDTEFIYEKGMMEELFPELAESEDEKVRKEIISALKWANDDGVYNKHIDWLEKQGSQKHMEEAKLKFKIGDWVCNAISLRNISSIENGMYYFDEGDKMPTEFVDKYYELWTINDAEKGDVLIDKSGNIGIFEKCVGMCWNSNIYLGCNNALYNIIGGSHIITGTKPATKKQRELLFKKMENRVYKWDPEKKKTN